MHSTNTSGICTTDLLQSIYVRNLVVAETLLLLILKFIRETNFILKKDLILSEKFCNILIYGAFSAHVL